MRVNYDDDRREDITKCVRFNGKAHGYVIEADEEAGFIRAYDTYYDTEGRRCAKLDEEGKPIQIIKYGHVDIIDVVQFAHKEGSQKEVDDYIESKITYKG